MEQGDEPPREPEGHDGEDDGKYDLIGDLVHRDFRRRLREARGTRRQAKLFTPCARRQVQASIRTCSVTQVPQWVGSGSRDLRSKLTFGMPTSCDEANVRLRPIGTFRNAEPLCAKRRVPQGDGTRIS